MEENGTTTVLVRFESDEITDKAVQINGEKVQGHTLKVGLTITPEEDRRRGKLPTVLDEPKDIADCLGRRFSYISSESSGDPRFKEQKQRAEREDLNFSTMEPKDYNKSITPQELH